MRKFFRKKTKYFLLQFFSIRIPDIMNCSTEPHKLIAAILKKMPKREDVLPGPDRKSIRIVSIFYNKIEKPLRVFSNWKTKLVAAEGGAGRKDLKLKGNCF